LEFYPIIRGIDMKCVHLKMVLSMTLGLTGIGQAREDEKENQAVEAVRSYCGKVTRDKDKPGMPVVAVSFEWTGATDERLGVLAPFTHLTSLNLGWTKVTDAGCLRLTDTQCL
jgi:hypothetical protein